MLTLFDIQYKDNKCNVLPYSEFDAGNVFQTSWGGGTQRRGKLWNA